MKALPIIMVLPVVLTSSLAAQAQKPPAAALDYLGQTPPDTTPVVFAPGVVSTLDNEHSAPSFSPGGDEVFWFANRKPGPDNDKWLALSKTMRRENGRWSEPRPSPFAGMVTFSPDGQLVYFSARSDLCTAEKQGDTWSEPRCLGIVSRFAELKSIPMASASRTGTLYFLANKADSPNEWGLYRTELVNGAYAQPRLLPDGINLRPHMNWTPFIAPDESYLLFSSSRAGNGDLYVSRRQADGGWSEPLSLGAPVNTDRQEGFPGLSPDGRYLFFVRDVPGRENDVFWVDVAGIPALHALETTR